MEALRQDRMIGPDLDSTIGHSGVRESDEFILDIFQERKKSFRLNRTKYKIICGKKYDFDFQRPLLLCRFLENMTGFLSSNLFRIISIKLIMKNPVTYSEVLVKNLLDLMASTVSRPI